MKIEILVIGRNEEILQTVIRLINKNEQWNATGVLTDEAAISSFEQLSPVMVLLTNGIDASSEKKLREHFARIHPGCIVIQHYGGGSGLLSNEILEALNRHERNNRD